MTRRIYITGAAGTGVSSLGRALAQRLHVSHADVDDGYWCEAVPPFVTKRSKDDRRSLLAQQTGAGGWVLSGCVEGWGEDLIAEADLIVFLMVPTPIRMDRLIRRERQDHGRRILPGGDMCTGYERLIGWAAQYDDPDFKGRNMYRQEAWLERQTTPVLRLGGTLPLMRLVNKVMDHKAVRRTFA